MDARADVHRADRRARCRTGSRAKNIIGVGLALQAGALAWIAAVSTPTTPYSELIAPFAIAGVGMALFFAPVANIVLSAVRPEEEGKASGANNAIRELGGVFGVAVLASIFAHAGGYKTRRRSRTGCRQPCTSGRRSSGSVPARHSRSDAAAGAAGVARVNEPNFDAEAA